jgi:hypothetical protein
MIRLLYKVSYHVRLAWIQLQAKFLLNRIERKISRLKKRYPDANN